MHKTALKSTNSQFTRCIDGEWKKKLICPTSFKKLVFAKEQKTKLEFQSSLHIAY